MKNFRIDNGIVSKALMEAIDKLMNEEMGIATDVAKKVREVKLLIKSNIKNSSRNKVDDGVWRYEGSIKCEIFGYEYTINYNIINYKDYDVYAEHSEYFVPDGSSSFSGRFIKLYVLSISGEFQENTFGDTLQHEIEHIYQIVKQGKPLLQNNNLYSKALSSMRSNENNGWISRLAKIIYYTRNEEHDAFVNGLYAQLVSQDSFYDRDNIVKMSNPYQIAMFLKSEHDSLEKEFNNVDFIESAKYYGRPRKWFISQAEIGHLKIMRKMMKVISKAEKDFWQMNEDFHISNPRHAFGESGRNDHKVNNFYNIHD